MIGKKATFSSAQNRNTPNKSISKDIYGICVYENGCVRIKCNSESAESQDERSQVQSNRAQNQYKRAQREDERAHCQIERAPKEDERGQSQKQHFQRERAEIQDHRATDEDHRAASQDEPSQVQRDIQNRSATDVIRSFSTTQKHVSFLNLRSKSPKPPPSPTRKQRKGTKVFKHHYHPLQLENNAKEQRFLSTIIIIALTAVLTVMVGTINAQFYELLFEKRPQTHRFCSRYIVSILPSILLSIACA